ncbi:MAG: hypothetical protein L3J66_08180 [Bacteroidales bacterium]|nr:hypothetical protein [Bacteroidales bacterium]
MQLKYITTSPELNESLNHLINVPSFAIDLEFDKNRYAYGFNLCLVQIYSGEYCYLIDPLAKDLDIGLLFPLLENEKIQKVVFSFGEDLRLLHSLGCFPRNLFDLAVAAKLLNYPPGSLAALLEETLKIQLNKSSQNSNWLRRPLSEKQLSYASRDVVHLLKLHKIIVGEAVKNKKLSWIKEENAGFDKLSFAGLENNNFIKNKDKVGLTEFEWHLFKKLLFFREEVGEKTGKPSYQVANKELLKEIALQPDKINRRGNRKGEQKILHLGAFKTHLKKFQAEAENLNLSHTAPAIKPLTKEEAMRQRAERSKAEQIKKQFFKPIQSEIIKEHGEHAATLILGNRAIAALIAGETEQLKDYQLKLIANYGRRLRIDLSRFLTEQQSVYSRHQKDNTD